MLEMDTDRIDKVLTDLGIVASRSKAQSLIKSGSVLVNGVVAKKSNQIVSENDTFEIINDPCPWVSRAGLKLDEAMEIFKPSVDKTSVCLDIGASTGGFTQVLLSHNPKQVFSVDVGSDQLHNSLKGEEKIVSLENTDARNLDSSQIPPIDCMVVDASFIGLAKILPVPLSLVKPSGWCIALIKPQFEVGKVNIGKGGVVKPNGSTDEAIENIKQFFVNENWNVIDVIPSPITGSAGNLEFLLYGIKK